MLKETEAEDRRWIMLAVSTVAQDEADGIFERTLSIAVSLIDRYLKDGWHIRLLLGDQQELLASGEEQFFHLLHAIALCERRPAGAVVPQAMADRLAGFNEGPRILLTPGTDTIHSEMTPLVDYIISPQSHRDLFDGAGSGLSA
jgi:hypothetical protein